MKIYSFSDVQVCNMCGDQAAGHRVMGQRLNCSQGLNPSTKTGISVSVKRCTRCGLIYSHPQPIPSKIEDHYGQLPESYWSPEYFENDPAYFARQIDCVRRLIGISQGKRALDIGAGIGKAMLALDGSGFETFGIEPSFQFWERAVGRMGVSTDRLRHVSLEEAEFEADFFDFITFGAVLEHLYDPAAAISRSLKWLKPGGLLHIEVPSSDWLIGHLTNLFFRLRGTNYVTNLSPMHAPFHLYEFGLRSFTELGRQQNFKVLHHCYDVCAIPHFPRALHKPLARLMEFTRTGMQLTVYLQAL